MNENDIIVNRPKILPPKADVVFEMLAAKSPALKKAVMELKRLSQDEEAQMLYEAREKALKDKNTMMHSMQRDIAVNLIKRGLDLKDIAEDTGLPIEEISKIKAKMNRA